MDSVHVYEERLLSIVTAICTRAEDFEHANIISEHLQKRSPTEWAEEISKKTFKEAKILLGGPQAPSPRDLAQALPEIDGTTDPGVYIDLVLAVEGESPFSDGVYVGSAWSIGGGLHSRTEQHQSSTFRKGPRVSRSVHYRFVDSKSVQRTQRIRKIFQDRWLSGRAKDIDKVVATQHLAETVFQCWLATYTAPACQQRLQKMLAELCPWDRSSLRYVGLNFNVPVHHGFKAQREDALTLDADELKRRNARGKTHHRMNMTAAEFQHDKKMRADYRVRVEKEVMRLRKSGADESTVKIYQARCKQESAERRGKETPVDFKLLKADPNARQREYVPRTHLRQFQYEPVPEPGSMPEPESMPAREPIEMSARKRMYDEMAEEDPPAPPFDWRAAYVAYLAEDHAKLWNTQGICTKEYVAYYRRENAENY